MRTVSRVPEGVGLREASTNQAMLCIEKVPGTLLGFWSPAHTLSLNIPGYHFHFPSDDHSSGGHVLDLKADSLEIELTFNRISGWLFQKLSNFLRLIFLMTSVSNSTGVSW